jgi:hypothetical protein
MIAKAAERRRDEIFLNKPGFFTPYKPLAKADWLRVPQNRTSLPDPQRTMCMRHHTTNRGGAGIFFCSGGIEQRCEQ